MKNGIPNLSGEKTCILQNMTQDSQAPPERGQESGIRNRIYACTCIYCNNPKKNQPTILLTPHYYLLCSMGFGNPRFKDQKDRSNKKNIRQTTRCWHADTQTLFCRFYRSIFFFITYQSLKRWHTWDMGNDPTMTHHTQQMGMWKLSVM